jgi:NAD-dependent DNA ligase
LIHNVANIYDLTTEKLESLDRFAEKSAAQLVEAIAASKQQPLSRLLFGLRDPASARRWRRSWLAISARWTHS